MKSKCRSNSCCRRKYRNDRVLASDWPRTTNCDSNVPNSATLCSSGIFIALTSGQNWDVIQPEVAQSFSKGTYNCRLGHLSSICCYVATRERICSSAVRKE